MGIIFLFTRMSVFFKATILQRNLEDEYIPSGVIR